MVTDAIRAVHGDGRLRRRRSTARRSSCCVPPSARKTLDALLADKESVGGEVREPLAARAESSA